MTTKNKLILIAVLSILSSPVFAQWTLEKGKGYYKLSAWYLEADSHFTSSGDRAPNTTRTQFNTNIYAEYGISDRFDIVAFVPFFARTTENDVFSGTTGELLEGQQGEGVNSIGDIDLSLRYGLVQNDIIAWSVSLLLGLPTGESAGGSDNSFQNGDGEFNQLLRSDVGKSFRIGRLPSYGKLYVGYNNRTENFSDEFRFGAELGTKIIKKLWLIGRLEGVQSLQNGSLNPATSQGSIFANNIEFTSLGLEAAYYITKKIGVSANFASAVGGRLVYADPSFSVGVFLDVK